MMDFSASANIAYGAGVKDNVADIGHTRYVHNDAFKAKSEARVRNGSELAKVEIVAVVVEIHSACFHCGNELIVVCLSFGAADDLTDTRYEKVGSGNRFAVGTVLHGMQIILKIMISQELSHAMAARSIALKAEKCLRQCTFAKAVHLLSIKVRKSV